MRSAFVRLCGSCAARWGRDPRMQSGSDPHVVRAVRSNRAREAPSHLCATCTRAGRFCLSIRHELGAAVRIIGNIGHAEADLQEWVHSGWGRRCDAPTRLLAPALVCRKWARGRHDGRARATSLTHRVFHLACAQTLCVWVCLAYSATPCSAAPLGMPLGLSAMPSFATLRARSCAPHAVY